MSHPAVSQHLKVLREVGLVTVEKRGQQRIYRLDMEKMYEFEAWAHGVVTAWTERFDRLEEALEAEKRTLSKINNSNKK